MPRPTEDDEQDVLASARFGDLEDVQHFIATFSADALNAVQDDNGNSVLHMAAANGHAELLAHLLPVVDPKLLARRNRAGSTPLHWAAVNRHLDVARTLVDFSVGPGVALIDIKNDAGRSPLGEAELGGWDEGARWFVQVMNLDSDEIKEEETQSPVDPSQAVKVEIQDAEGQIARMTINPKAPVPQDQAPSRETLP